MRLSPAQIQQIERTVRRVPEVIVRVVSTQSNDFGSVRKHFGRIARYGELGLETDYGEVVRGPSVGHRLLEEMDLDLEEYHKTSSVVHETADTDSASVVCPRSGRRT